MTIPDYQLAKSARFLRRSFAFACVASLLLGSSTNAGTILQFSQLNPSDSVTSSVSGGVTTLSTAGNVDGGGLSIPVIVSNFGGTPEPPGFVLFETFAPIPVPGGLTGNGITFTGKIEFTTGAGGTGVNFLTATFTSATFTTSGTNAGTLMDSAPDLTFTSSMGTFDGATGMSLGFTPAVGNTTGALFPAANAGTFSATIVPEPGTLCLASIAVAIGTLAYGRKRVKID